MKKLFDFVGSEKINVVASMEKDHQNVGDKATTCLSSISESTCVVAEVAKVHSPEEIEKTSQVYLSSQQGFNNYCQECPELLMVQETDFQLFTLRVFCLKGKCVK